MKAGFAFQLVTERWLGTFLEDPLDVPGAVLDFVAGQLGISDPSQVRKYTKRANIRFGPFPLLSVQIPYTRSNVRDMAQRRAGG
jgi:hypothetical protein